MDSPLTPLGEAQARAMGGALRRLIAPDEVQLFTSPRGRAMATARILAETAGLPFAPIIDPDLAEISLGSWDGLTGAEIDAMTGDNWSSMDQYGWYFETPDGESYDAFTTRLTVALKRVRSHDAPVRIMISHGLASRVLRGLHLGLPRATALALSVPQGIIYRLGEGTVDEIDCRA
jgi:probable phosphoglycerate mutase